MSTSASAKLPAISPQSQGRTSYPLRLPAYQSSYLSRYHPYSARKRRHGRFQTQQPVDLMKTVDRRYDGIERPSLTLSVVAEITEVDDDELLHDPIPYEEQIVAASRSSTKSVTGFVELIIDFALAMRHKIKMLRAQRFKSSA
ncbi:hypothetical protein ABKN59_000732 [Abortiporus biennis]